MLVSVASSLLCVASSLSAPGSTPADEVANLKAEDTVSQVTSLASRGVQDISYLSSVTILENGTDFVRFGWSAPPEAHSMR